MREETFKNALILKIRFIPAKKFELLMLAVKFRKLVSGTLSKKE